MEKIIRKIIKQLSRLFSHIFKKEFSQKQEDVLTQFVMFGLVGVSNTLISYLINVGILLALRPLGFSWDYIVANIVAFILSVLWSFFWNNKFVFKTEDGKKRSIWLPLLKTYVAYGFTGIVLNNVLSWLWIDILNVSKFVAPLINLIISVPLNFILNKLWAFKND